MNAPTVIYHSADFDGIFCREIAKHFLPPETTFIGWNFGDKPLPVPKSLFYILDLPLLDSFGLKIEDGWIARDNPIMSKDERQLQPLDRLDWGNWIWIDHHKTAIEKYPKEVPGYRIDGVAACRLAWQWFKLHEHWDVREMHPPYDLPSKEHYINRNVLEPLAIRLAGEYDIWDKRDPDAETFQYGLRTCDPDFKQLLGQGDPFQDYTTQLVRNGAAAQAYAQRTDASVCKSKTWIMEWEGLKFLCVNSARFNSLFFAAKDAPEAGHDALLGFCFSGKTWTVSLYHAKHRTDLDLSEIAKKHGGGGHRGACGFTCNQLPFSL